MTNHSSSGSKKLGSAPDGRAETKDASIESAALSLRQASLYLGLKETSRWLDNAPVARVDMRKVGDGKPVWRWLRRDLDAFLQLRRFAPGETNPMDMQ